MPVSTGVSDSELDELSNASESGVDPIPKDREVVDAQTGKLGDVVDFRGTDYHVVAELPALVLIDLGIGSDPSSTPIEKLRALRQFVDYAVVPKERAAFLSALLKADPPVGQEELNGLIEKIAPMVTGRPT